jgi:hypothetical protein
LNDFWQRVWTSFWLQVYWFRMNESDDFEWLLATTLDEFSGWPLTPLGWSPFRFPAGAGLFERKRRFWATFGNNFGRVFWLQVYWPRMSERDDFERLLATTLDEVSGCETTTWDSRDVESKSDASTLTS